MDDVAICNRRQHLKPITGETTYTLACVDAAGATLTKSATVRIIPTFQEI